MTAGPNLPARPGFYWARWQAPWGQRGDGAPIGRWEIVDVFVNSTDAGIDALLLVLVPGVEKAQPLADFLWGEGPLLAPDSTATATGSA